MLIESFHNFNNREKIASLNKVKDLINSEAYAVHTYTGVKVQQTLNESNQYEYKCPTLQINATRFWLRLAAQNSIALTLKSHLSTSQNNFYQLTSKGVQILIERWLYKTNYNDISFVQLPRNCFILLYCFVCIFACDSSRIQLRFVIIIIMIAQCGVEKKPTKCQRPSAELRVCLWTILCCHLNDLLHPCMVDLFFSLSRLLTAFDDTQFASNYVVSIALESYSSNASARQICTVYTVHTHTIIFSVNLHLSLFLFVISRFWNSQQNETNDWEHYISPHSNVQTAHDVSPLWSPLRMVLNSLLCKQ